MTVKVAPQANQIKEGTEEMMAVVKKSSGIPPGRVQKEAALVSAPARQLTTRALEELRMAFRAPFGGGLEFLGRPT